MKIQIDTDKKTIKLEEGANLSKLFDFLEKLFPEGEWGAYELQTNTTIQNWGNPIVIKKHVPYRPWWEYPFGSGIIYLSGGCVTRTTTSGGTISTDMNHPNNQNITLTSGSTYTMTPESYGTVTNCASVGTGTSNTVWVDMSNAEIPEVATSGLAITQPQIMNFELN